YERVDRLLQQRVTIAVAPAKPFRMSRALRRRLVGVTVLALALSALGLVPTGGAALRVDPTELYVNYTGTNPVRLTVGGTVVRPGSTRCWSTSTATTTRRAS